MKLEEIGFYTLSDKRAATANETTPLQRCELLLTDRCNFNCPYCRKTGISDLGFEQAKRTVQLWLDQGVRNLRFSGGEPTLWPRLVDLVKFANKPFVKHIAISTNGSAKTELYYELIEAGINDFSISLDACCASTAQKMSGGLPIFDVVINNIEKLAKKTYVTLGVVLTPANLEEVYNIVELALDLGVSDVRLISAAQWDGELNIKVPQEAMDKFPILRYRINNFNSGRNVRGIQDTDCNKCPLIRDDIAAMNGKHYPCIIYLREGGELIGDIGMNMRAERTAWYNKTNTHCDPICRQNCLDVCIDYNNKAMEISSNV
jgi:molybdenum cofactor biosynthesis enzyme MoaA